MVASPCLSNWAVGNFFENKKASWIQIRPGNFSSSCCYPYFDHVSCFSNSCHKFCWSAGPRATPKLEDCAVFFPQFLKIRFSFFYFYFILFYFENKWTSMSAKSCIHFSQRDVFCLWSDAKKHHSKAPPSDFSSSQRTTLNATPAGATTI